MANFIINGIELGARIRSLRLKKNKTQSYFADMLYISPSYLALIESGKRIPNVDVLVQIANITDVSLDYLIFGKDESLDPACKTFHHLRNSYSDAELQRALKLAEYYLKLSSAGDADENIEL